MKPFYPAIAWSLFIGLVSLLPSEDMPPLHDEDKWAHIVFYALLTFLIARGLYRTKQNKRRAIELYLIAFLVAGIYGAIIEVIQLNFISGRQGDIVDFIANLFGGIIAFPMHWLLNVNRK